MPASELLQQSTYGPWSVINEKLTTAISHFIRTGSTYFAENEQKSKNEGYAWRLWHFNIVRGFDFL